MRVIGIHKEEEKDVGTEKNIRRNNDLKIPNFMKTVNPQAQAQPITSTRNRKKTIPKPIIIK